MSELSDKLVRLKMLTEEQKESITNWKRSMEKDRQRLRSLHLDSFIAEGVRMMALTLDDYLFFENARRPKTNDDWVYFRAILKRAKEDPMKFFDNNYFHGCWYYINHERDKKGRLVSCKAVFPDEYEIIKRLAITFQTLKELGAFDGKEQKTAQKAQPEQGKLRLLGRPGHPRLYK